MVTFLRWAYDQFPFSPEFLSALPIGGLDGSLKQRMGGREKLKMRAMTGTMKGISSISGYITTHDGEPLAFAIFIDGFVKPSEEYKNSLEDQICSLLVGFSRNRE
jgi:D-alanyl-D-alanine carboxypeptidase/D-alanyl-D-alanine-endopeptidase (penicillin-binding protein 4)